MQLKKRLEHLKNWLEHLNNWLGHLNNWLGQSNNWLAWLKNRLERLTDLPREMEKGEGLIDTSPFFQFISARFNGAEFFICWEI